MRARSDRQFVCRAAHDMIIEFAPLVFGTAALLAIFLFFSVAEH
jgi:hypothetical protein